MEVFYTFTWAPRRQGGGRPRHRDGQQGQRPAGRWSRNVRAASRAAKARARRRQDGKGGRDHKGGKGGKPQGAKTYQARPPKKEKPIDPDNPFAAALMGLTEKK